MSGVVRLEDPLREIVVQIAPDFGNNAFSMRVRGHEILWTPEANLETWRAHPALGGVPLLAPWANRLDHEGFWANGKSYTLNPTLGNLRYDAYRLPIHGLLAFSDRWEVVRHDTAEVTSRLDFWRFPELMAQFPFAHSIEITHRLANGRLEIETQIENLSAEPMPAAIGYHPYFALTDSARDEWKLHVAARQHVVLSDKLIPTGERKANDLADPFLLASASVDDVFTDLTGYEFSMEGRGQRVSVRFGPKYTVAIVYAPPGRPFVCFEPMAALTNAFNLAHAGVDAQLQSIEPRAIWRESFWITPTGF